jgi:hypothetical protein
MVREPSVSDVFGQDRLGASESAHASHAGANALDCLRGLSGRHNHGLAMANPHTHVFRTAFFIESSVVAVVP